VLDDDMPALYSGATFFIFTPIYEGFAMPPLEAFACGTPTIASNTTSLPEAVGNAAVMVDPYDVDAIREKMTDMLQKVTDDPRQFDERMEEHLRSLNWRASAEITAAALTGLPVEHFKKEATV